MNTISESEFLAWAEARGMGLDPKYPHSAVLTFQASPAQARFWEVPAEPECRPYFILSLLELMGEWQHCYAWRHLGSWPAAADPRRINDVVELQILKGLGLPLGTAEVVMFDRAELDRLVTLIFSTTVFGWSVGDDLYVVPDHARFILQTDHHAVLHVSFRSSEDLDHWVAQMAAREFPLPDEVPDATFRWPSWMKREE